VCDCRSIASGLGSTSSAPRLAPSHSSSADIISEVSLQPTQPHDSTLKPGLSAAELEKKTLSILEEYLHICDIQVFNPSAALGVQFTVSDSLACDTGVLFFNLSLKFI